MSDLVTRDVGYAHDGCRMVGLVCAPRSPSAAAVLLVHDAFGVSDDMAGIARLLAGHGHPVFVADVWGGRTLPRSDAEIGPLIGAMAADRPRWLGRLAAAQTAAAAQPELAGRPLAILGYCFGGSSALEHLRTGADVAGVVAVHPGLDLLHAGWEAAGTAPVLLCVGADDPMATADQRGALQTALSGAGIDWELQLYSGTTHAFTSLRAQHSPAPDVFAYHARSAARAWTETLRFLGEIPALQPTA